MAQTLQLPATAGSKTTGLETWMIRVLERADKVADGWGVDDIHDLRVALRRCRTIAEALSQVNPDPVWRKVKKSSRDVFRSLGDLRDTQMERAWLKKLWPARDPMRARLRRELLRRELLQRESAKEALAAFDRRGWKKWSRRMSRKAHFFPVESVVFQRLALAKLVECAALFERARRRPSAVGWHRARIGLKRFRYITDNFLPQRYEAWAGDVKRLQDLLGEVHDLDVLKADLRKSVLSPHPAGDGWLEKIQIERKTRLDEVVSKIAGTGSVCALWRAGFPWGHSLTAPPIAKRRTA